MRDAGPIDADTQGLEIRLPGIGEGCRGAFDERSGQIPKQLGDPGSLSFGDPGRQEADQALSRHRIVETRHEEGSSGRIRK